MNENLSERRLVENQVVFRQANEQVPKELDSIKAAAESEGYSSLVHETDMPLHFYCECSDENCRKRIVMTPGEYKELHQNHSQFVLVPGHEVPEIEQVVRSGDNYIAVEKYKEPPKSAEKLKPTDIDNT